MNQRRFCRRALTAVLAVVLFPSVVLAASLERPSAHQMRSWQAQLAALPAGERARIVRARQLVASLPPVEQQQLRARFDQLDRLHRDGWRMGPTVGKYWPGLYPLLGLVPETQRQPLRAWLWSLGEDDLQRLVRLTERTPPQERDALRKTLLELPPAQRAVWLRTHVAA